jgi:hypothetical protein
MWRYTLLISINFYASMIAYGVAYGLVSNSNERTLWNNFTWLELTITIANVLYCLTFSLALMWLLHHERRIVQVGTFNNYHLHIIKSLYIVASAVSDILLKILILQEANMVRSWLYTIGGLIPICIIHFVLCVKRPPNFQNMFLFEILSSVCGVLMYLFRWFTMVMN